MSNAEAIAFYEKFGFKITETIAGAARAPSFSLARRHPMNRLLQEAHAQRLPQADAGQEIRKRKEVWPFVLRWEGSIACVGTRRLKVVP